MADALYINILFSGLGEAFPIHNLDYYNIPFCKKLYPKTYGNEKGTFFRMSP